MHNNGPESFDSTTTTVTPGPMGAPTDAPLIGRTVTVRPVESADAAALHALSHGDATTESLWTWMPYGPFADADAMRAWIGACMTSADPAFRSVVLNATGRPTGMASFLNRVDAHARLELGHIWYAPEAQRSAVNTETIYLMLMESFERLGSRRVEWKCDACNERSQAAALRLGFRYEGIFRQHMIVKGRNRDTAWFAITDGDWPDVRAHMERWLYSGESGLSLTELNR